MDSIKINIRFRTELGRQKLRSQALEIKLETAQDAIAEVCFDIYVQTCNPTPQCHICVFCFSFHVICR